MIPPLALLLILPLLPLPSHQVPVLDFNHPDKSITLETNSIKSGSTFASLANILNKGSPLTFFKENRPVLTHPASPALFDAHFTKLAPIYNTKAIIRADFVLDFSTARKFCSDILQGLPTFYHPVVTAYLDRLAHTPSAPLEPALTINPSSNLGRKLGRARKGTGKFRTPISRLLDFVYACHIREFYTMATLTTTALASINSTCRAWHMLDDSIVPNPSPHYSTAYDPLRDDRQANVLQFHDPKTHFTNNALPTTGDHDKRRGKRGVVTGIALGATIAAAAAGGIWYASAGSHSDQLETHAKAINTLNTNTEAVISALEALDQRFIFEQNYTRALASVQLLSRAADTLTATIESYSATFAAAKTGKLTLGAITSADLQSVFIRALETAYSSKLFLPTAFPMDLLNMPATAHSSGYTYTLSISIPAADKELNLFEFTPTSILAEDDSASPMLIDVITEHNYVATNNDTTATSPVPDDFLSSCLRFRSSIACFTRLGLSETPHSCIENIFLRRRHETGKTCDFQRHKKNWSATLSPDNVMHIASTEEIKANITCSDANSTISSVSPTTIHKGNSATPLPPGCSLISTNFTLPGLPYALAIISIVKQINFVLNTDILLGHSLLQFDQATSAFSQHGQEPPKSIKQALEQYKHLPSLPIDDAIGSTWTAILILFGLLVLVIFLLSLYIRHLRGSTGRTKAFSKQAFTDIASFVLGEQPGTTQYPRKLKKKQKAKIFTKRYNTIKQRKFASASHSSPEDNVSAPSPMPSPATHARNRLLASTSIFSPATARIKRNQGRTYHAPEEQHTSRAHNDYLNLDQLPLPTSSAPDPPCTSQTANVLGTFSANTTARVYPKVNTYEAADPVDKF